MLATSEGRYVEGDLVEVVIEQVPLAGGCCIAVDGDTVIPDEGTLETEGAP